ncbi:MAG: 4Fe-4S binding protein [Candidatus Margulisiibacteriota bacterium]
MKKKPFIHPGKMIELVLRSLFKKPATVNYPFEKMKMPEHFRGKLKFIPEKCIGCMLCVKDCPANAIKINKVGDKKFEAEIDLGKCIYCAQCVDSCPRKALEITPEFELAQIDRNKLKITFNAEGAENKA